MSTDQPQRPDASNPEPQWLRWGKRLQSIAQNGLAHACDPYDRERYEEVRQVAAELMAAGGRRDVDEVLGLFIRQTGHATPKVDVRGAVFQRDSILLVRERDDGMWALPGGWAETSESPSEAVEREVLEETGWVVRAGRLVAVYDYSKHPHRPPLPFHVYMLLFVCEVVEPGRLGARDGPEVSRVELFCAGNLPPLSPRRVTPGQLDRLFRHLRTPGAPVDCD